MAETKADIIKRLNKEILPLQGFKHKLNNPRIDSALGIMKYAFPNHSFPLAAIHEFSCESQTSHSCTSAFITTLLSPMMQNGEIALWVSNERKVFPPALKLFGISPDKIIFINIKKDRELRWVLEEALQCPGLVAVIAELKELDFITSRRLQLAVEQSKVTGFIIRKNQRLFNTTASLTRWKIDSLASSAEEDMPGIGFPRWNIELMKVRNGKPGYWQVECIDGKFRHITQATTITVEQQRKTG